MAVEAGPGDACPVVARELTHVVICPPADGGAWAPTMYVQRHAGTREPYFLGLEESLPLTEEQVDSVPNAYRLPAPVEMPDDRTTWIGPDGVFWLADLLDPIADPHRVELVRPDQLSQ